MKIKRTKTTQIISANNDHSDSIIQAGEVVNMSFKKGATLSLRAGKLFHLLIKEAGSKVTEDKQHKIMLADLNFIHRSKDELIDTIEELQSTIVSVELISRRDRKYTSSDSILGNVEREHAEDGELRFKFSETIRHLISRSTHWAALSKRAVLSFESRYSLRLYEVLSLRFGLDRKFSETFSLEDFRETMGVPAGKLPEWYDLKRKVIEPAIAEVNHLCGFTVSYTPEKRSRKIIGITLAWAEKTEEDRINAAKELERPRDGRKARRSGTVEDLAVIQHQQREAISRSLTEAGKAAQKKNTPKPEQWDIEDY